MYPRTEPINVTKCKLEDGSIVEYDACASNPNAYNTDFFELIGKGLLYSISGEIQVNQKTPLYFYRWVAN